MSNCENNLKAEFKPGPSPVTEYSLAASMVINADTRYLEIIGDFIRKNAIIAGFADMEARSIELAIDEMVSNSIIHGYTNELGGEIRVQVFIIDNGMKVVLEEAGKEFDPFATKEPDLDAPLSERKIGGLGLFIVKKIMDEIYYESAADRLKKFTLIKWVDKAI
ncbi:MAG: ATP-binding protein [candidate division Zixibacteria bacterium]|nr:ATP-binding protein [Candidatus Tariuqbacter arcticus]